MASLTLNLLALIILSYSTKTSSMEFELYLPFTHTSNSLINVVVSSSLQSITLVEKNLTENLLHAYTIHDVLNLNLDIPDRYLETHKNIIITMNTGFCG